MTHKISNLRQIESYIHCALCMKEIPEGESPQSYARYEIGWTKQGLQVWCDRHHCNIIHIDFEGQRHPANTARSEIGAP